MSCSQLDTPDSYIRSVTCFLRALDNLPIPRAHPYHNGKQTNWNHDGHLEEPESRGNTITYRLK